MAKYTFLVPAFKPDFLDIAIGSMLSQSFEDFNIKIYVSLIEKTQQTSEAIDL